MKKSMRKQRKAWNKKFTLSLVSLILLLAVSVTGVWAYLVAESNLVTNTFSMASVPNEVVETIEGNTKKDVKIQNTGNTTAYIRATVVVTWADEAGNIHSVKPVEGKDYQITWMLNAEDGQDSKWVKGTDGYYYYIQPVSAGQLTEVLFTDCKVKDDVAIPNGYSLSVEIMGQSIQADGVDGDGNAPVELAWGVVVNENKSLTVVNAANN